MALERFIAPKAKRDLEDIFHFISADDEAAAWRLLQHVEKVIILLAERPFLGPMTQLPGLSLRKMSVPPYIVSTACRNGPSKSCGFSIPRVTLGIRNCLGQSDGRHDRVATSLVGGQASFRLDSAGLTV